MAETQRLIQLQKHPVLPVAAHAEKGLPQHPRFHLKLGRQAHGNAAEQLFLPVGRIDRHPFLELGLGNADGSLHPAQENILQSLVTAGDDLPKQFDLIHKERPPVF